MADAHPIDDPPRRPGEGSAWRWVQVAAVVLLLVAAACAYTSTLVRLAPGAYTATWMDSQAADAWSHGWRGGAGLLAAVGLLLLARPRWTIRRPALVAACVSGVVAYGMLQYHATWWTGDAPWSRRAWEGDALLFERMAHEWPWRPAGWFRYRIVAPWLATALAPWDPWPWEYRGASNTDVGYWRLALFSVATTGPVLSLLLRDLRFGTAARHLGVLLYLCSFAVLYNTWNYAMPDPLALLLLALACRSIVRGRDVELAVWLLLGGLTKEVVLFLVPARWLWARRTGLDLPQALRAGLVALPALAVFAWLRFRPGEAAEYTGFVTGNAWLFPWKHQPDNVARLWSPFAAGWALVVLALRKPDRWTLAGIGFAVPCLLSLLVTDAGRMLVYLTPFAIPAMLRAAGAGERVSRRGLIALLLVCLSMRLWEPFAPLWKVPVMVRRPLSLLLAPVCAWLAYRVTESSTEASSPASAA